MLSTRTDSEYTLFESLPVMLHAINGQGELVMVSDRWLEVLGYERQEVIGRKSVAFLTPQSQALATQVLPEFFRQGFCVDVAYQFVRKDGGCVDVLLSANASYNEQGEFVHSLAFLTDITELKTTKRQLEAQSAMTNQVIESIPDALVLVDESRRILRVNAAAVEMFGYQIEEVAGQTTAILYTNQADYLRQGQARYHKEGQPIGDASTSYLSTYRRKDGEVFLAETRGGVVRSLDGEGEEHVQYLGIVRDVTERERAKVRLTLQEQRIHTIVEAMPDLVFEHDAYGRIHHLAHRAHVLASDGLTPTHQLAEFLEPEVFEVFLSHARSAKDSGEVQVFTCTLQRRGHMLSYEWRINATAQDHLVSVVRDVTDLERAQQDLVLRHTQLEDRNRLLDQFAYIASHDLRSPLRAITQISSWFAEDYGHLLDAAGARYLEELRQRAGSMDRMLVDLLNFVRAPEGSAPVPVEIGPFVDDILSQTNMEGGFRIFLDSPPTIHIEKTAFQAVLTNLVSNAVIHHDRDTGHFRLGIQEGATCWFIVFEDDGPGIAPEHQERVWQIFQSAHHPKQRTLRTSGLGLAIVKQLVHDLNGTIALDAPVHQGRGTRFSISWPKKKEVS